jgi:L-asparaginase / beta-aspartyl-peptidase
MLKQIKHGVKHLMLSALVLPIMSSAGARQIKHKEQPMPDKQWSLVIHGGAGVLERSSMTPEKDVAVRAALTRSLDAGSAVLAKGGDAMDAVTAAIMVLEDDPNFNAGRGAVFTYDGHNELDASIMDGRTRSAGAVTGITRTKNPILLARAVMEKSQHVFLSREGADEFSREQGLEQVDPSYFATPERAQQLVKMKEKKLSSFDVDLKYGTVGAVAVDETGNVAAGTSTGGLTGKRWGRIGDSPVIGAGNYADNRACGVSATGSGEYFIRLGVAHEICARMRMKGENAKVAADHVMKEIADLGGSGGVIVSSPDGTTAWSFNTPGMYRGKSTSKGVKIVGVYGDEK